MTALASRPAQASFHLGMANVCLALTFVGFIPTFFAPVVQGNFHRPPVFYLHGLVVLAWMIFYWSQAWLVAKGRLTAHREWGIAGAALAALMVTSVVVLMVVRLNQAVPEPEGAPGSRSFIWADVSCLLFLVGCIGGALANTRRPQVHKRLMLMANISLVTVAEGRLGGLTLAFVNDTFGQPPIGWPGLVVALPIVLTPIWLIIAALLLDRRPDGNLSRTYLGGLPAALVLLSPVAAIIGGTPFGLAVADLVKSLPN